MGSGAYPQASTTTQAKLRQCMRMYAICIDVFGGAFQTIASNIHVSSPVRSTCPSSMQLLLSQLLSVARLLTHSVLQELQLLRRLCWAAAEVASAACAQQRTMQAGGCQ
jgi:hypothetical protein